MKGERVVVLIASLRKLVPSSLLLLAHEPDCFSWMYTELRSFVSRFLRHVLMFRRTLYMFPDFGDTYWIVRILLRLKQYTCAYDSDSFHLQLTG